MKKIYILICLILLTGGLKAQDTLFYDGFESYSPFEIDNVGNWTLIDVDLLPTYTIGAFLFLNTNGDTVNIVPKSFMTWDPSMTLPSPITGPEWTSHNSATSMMCLASVPAGGLFNDDWLISPMISLDNISRTLNFWAKTANSTYGLETFNVGISTTDTMPASFTIIGSLISPDTAWTNYNFDLSSYKNQSVYVGIHCVSQDRFGLLIDDVAVIDSSIVSSVNEVSFENILLYPSATQYSFIIQNNSGQSIDYINIYNLNGQLVKYLDMSGHSMNEKLEVSIQEFPVGKYLVEVIGQNGKSTMQVIKL